MSEPLFKFEMRPEDNKEITEVWRSTVEKHLNDCMAKRWEMVESLMLLYTAGTGFRPDQLELVERQETTDRGGLQMVWTIRPMLKPDSETKVNEEGKADPCHVQLVSLPKQPPS